MKAVINFVDGRTYTLPNLTDREADKVASFLAGPQDATTTLNLPDGKVVMNNRHVTFATFAR